MAHLLFSAGILIALLSVVECTGGSEEEKNPEHDLLLLQLPLQQVLPRQDSQQASISRVSSKGKFFVWLTDPHVDLYYGREGQQCTRASASITRRNKLGTMGCDPPLQLLEATVTAAAEAAAGVGGAEFLLFSGDFTRHSQDEMPSPEENVTSTIAQAAQVLAGMPVTTGSVAALSIGNSDSPRNYWLNITSSESENPWLSSVAETLAAEGISSDSDLSDYTYGGYFETEMGDVTVITINTIIYSVSHTPAPPAGTTLPTDPFGQLKWLHGRLEQAATENRKVWIVGHIPPGIETYGYTELWHPQYLMAYRSILEEPVLGDSVAAQLFGHVHADEFRVLPQGSARTGPILLAAATSPVYGNNPTFRLVEYDPETKRPLNYLTYYAALEESEGDMRWQLGEWKLGYSAVETYEALQHGIRASGALFSQAFKSLVEDLASGGQQWNAFAAWYKVQKANDLIQCGVHPEGRESALSCVKAYTCALEVVTQEEYDTCRSRHTSIPDRPSISQNLSAEEFWRRAREAHLRSMGYSV